MENLPLLPIALFFIFLTILVIVRYRRRKERKKNADLQKTVTAIRVKKNALTIPWQNIIDKNLPPIPPMTKKTRNLQILIGMTGSVRTGSRLHHQGVTPDKLQKELMKTDEEKETEREKLRQTPLP